MSKFDFFDALLVAHPTLVDLSSSYHKLIPVVILDMLPPNYCPHHYSLSPENGKMIL